MVVAPVRISIDTATDIARCGGVPPVSREPAYAVRVGCRADAAQVVDEPAVHQQAGALT
jgi:hypothetical protein